MNVYFCFRRCWIFSFGGNEVGQGKLGKTLQLTFFWWSLILGAYNSSVATADLNFFTGSWCSVCDRWSGCTSASFNGSSLKLLEVKLSVHFHCAVGSRSTFNLIAQVSSGFPVHTTQTYVELRKSWDRCWRRCDLTLWSCVLMLKMKKISDFVFRMLIVVLELRKSDHVRNFISLSSKSQIECVQSWKLANDAISNFPTFQLVAGSTRVFAVHDAHLTDLCATQKWDVDLMSSWILDLIVNLTFKKCLSRLCRIISQHVNENYEIHSVKTGFGRTWCFSDGRCLRQLIVDNAEMKIVVKLS